MFGPQLFADLVDMTFDLGQVFYTKLQTDRDFQPLLEPQCNILTFRYCPAELRGQSPQEQGEFQRRSCVDGSLNQARSILSRPTSTEWTCCV